MGVCSESLFRLNLEYEAWVHHVPEREVALDAPKVK